MDGCSRIAVLGLGSIGRRHLRNLVALSEELGLEAVSGYDNAASRRAEAKEEAPDALIAESMAETVSNADAVFVCVPTNLHVPVVNQLLDQNPVHLYLEKPLSHTLHGLEDLLFRTQRLSRQLVVGYMLPRHPLLQRLKTLIDNGSLGRIVSARAESGFYLPKWHPWEDYRDFYMSWKSGGGGALLDSSHEINYLEWLFGEVHEAQGVVGTFSDLEITSDDLCCGIIRFRSGVVAEVHLDLLQFDESRYCKVIGTTGVAVADLTKSSLRWNTVEDEAWKTEEIAVDFDGIYLDQVRDFVKRCRTGSATITQGREGLATMHVIEAMRRSSNLGCVVRLPLHDV